MKKEYSKKWGLIFFIIIFNSVANAQVVDYKLKISEQQVNFASKNVKAMTINGTIPGPTIEAKEGDTLRIVVENDMNVDTSIHWHGILLPNEQDGVPYLTTPPIKAHSKHFFEFKVIQAGTYWYHSHTGLQEQRGVYGSIVLHPQQPKNIADEDKVLVLSDWTNENPREVFKNLKRDGDYYALKKDSVQSWLKVITNGPQAVKNRLNWSWIRMGAMDLSDVGYDAFLANGEQQHQLSTAAAGSTIKVRLINAAASTYFNIEYAGGPMMVVAADGLDVKPFSVDRLKIAIAETYDILIKVPNNKAYELRATAEDGTGYGSAIIGAGELMPAADIAKPNLFLATHEHGNNHQNHQQHKNNNKEKMEDYSKLRALEKTVLPSTAPTREVALNLTGNMERYVWSFNNTILSKADKILIKKGENVRFILVNETMMHHPIHLHGHFFRVVNQHGEYSPLKHTVNVPPMDRVIIEFAATEDRDWFFHCHNLYHMKAGMARVVSYQDSTTANKNTIKKLSWDNRWFYSRDLLLASNMMAVMAKASNSSNAIELEFDFDYQHLYEVEVAYERNINRFFDIYAGIEIERQERDETPEDSLIFGFKYVLPLLVESDWRIDSNGKLRLELGADLQLTDRAIFEWMWNTDDEYRLLLSYEVSKKFLLNINYDSDYNFGGGFRWKF